MSAIQDQPGQSDMPTLPTPPPPPWFYGDQGDPWARGGQGGWSDGGGPGGAGGPGGPGGWGGGGWGAEPPRRPRRGRGVAVMAAVAAVGLAVGAAGFHFARSAASGSPAAATAALSTSQIANKTDPGLVDIVSTLGDENAEAAGTGQVMTSSGEVLTNDHVITGATSLKATDVGNGRTYTATVVGYDQTDDVAVIQLQGASGLATVSFGNSSQVTSGSPVVALGNAGGKGGTPSVAAGSIIGLNQSITASDEGSDESEQLSGMLETNANIQPGDSGGPLVNGSGQVIGMDTAAYTGSGGSSNQSPYGQGPDGQSPWWQFPSGQSPSGQSSSGQSQTQGYAIPISRALSLASEIEGGHASSTVHIGATGFLGVELSGTGSSGSGAGQGGFGGGGEATSGVALQGVLAGSPAAAAGLSQGDVITSIAGHSVSSQSTIESVIQQYHPGDKVSVGWSDEFGQSHTSTVTLANGPAD
ncbi:MAG TPA: trypsin-like peptidase domain-containing protein [Streptosporangiaceae bacterium]|nr:trypsin-like peptidase domain-containing protein [Streptosporangiaceae bacterium]